MNATPTQKGQEFASKADASLREGKLDEARAFHRSASIAFKEARDSLMEGDTNTKNALNILIDFHREREKNLGVPRFPLQKPVPFTSPTLQSESATANVSSTLQANPNVSPTSSTNSLNEAWTSIQEFDHAIANSPPPTEISIKTVTLTPEWKKTASQSVMMGESFYFVPGANEMPAMHSTNSSSSNTHAPSSASLQKITATTTSPEKLQATIKSLMNEVERLSKENHSLRDTILREREESKTQKDKFWKMFALVKAALEEASSRESELKALTLILHTETETRKKLESELSLLKRTF